MNYEIGSRIGDYEVLQVLGAGGMGRVYKVRNTISDRIEAMKLLLPNLEGDPDLANRFMREIKVQASLDHPNIAALHTALRVDNQLLMLMEFVEGVTLESTMESGPVPIERAIDYMSQVLSALSYAHGRGVVHRDLKPANMMITSGGVVKLMDFGIAKMAADRKLTQTGRTVGSLYYMSPEQIKGVLDLDPRSDLYSLGVTLYEVLTGARPFQGDSEYSIMAAHLQSNPPPPIEISPNLPPALSQITLLALEKDPAKRFQTADSFRSALTSLLKPQQAPALPARPVEEKKAVAAPPPLPVPPAQAQSSVSHSKRGAWIAVGSLLTLAVLVIVAVQIPRFRHTEAESGTVQSSVDSRPVEPQTPAVSPVTQPIASQAPAVAQPAPAPDQPARRTAGPASTPSAPQPSAVQIAAPVSQPVQPVQTPAVEPAQPAAAPALDPKTAEALSEVREQLNLLTVRAVAVKGSLDTLRRQQEALGMSLRSDMAASAQRMSLYLSETDAALNRQDAPGAKKNLNLADREVSKLESFLGK